MNKDLLNQLPADEQLVASKLTSVAEDMQLSSGFQWELETQLMDTAKKQTSSRQGWYPKALPSLGWAVLAIFAVFLLDWTIRSLATNAPVATEEAPAVSFESGIRQGTVCPGPLTLAHNFSVFLTNADKTGFIALDEANPVEELRSFAWSPDGKQLALTGGLAGGNIYLTDSMGSPLEILLNPQAGYLMGVAWSHDGKQLLTWSLDSNSTLYIIHADGTNLTEKRLGLQFFETPQFAPDHESVILYGADSSGAGLFQVKLDGSQARKISALAQGEDSYASSPDGTRLAFIELDRELGEARLVVEEVDREDKAVLARLPIPEGTVPDSSNLSWSRDGKSLVFEFDSAIYLAHADGSGLIKIIDSAHTPAISADGRCLAYISQDQVFLMDLTGAALTSPVRVADLPAGRQPADIRLDKLQWGH